MLIDRWHEVVGTGNHRSCPGATNFVGIYRRAAQRFQKDDNCEHDWPLLPNEDGEFHCKRCTQWRVRVKQHERGDRERTVIRKGYQV